MFNRKKISGAVAALMLAAPAMGADYGIGVAFESNSEKIYFPIRVSPTFLVEPSFEQYRQDLDQQLSPGGALSTDYRYQEFGIGLFAVRRVAENLDTHLGARLGYQKFKTTGSTSSSSSAYGITPTIGVEYFVHKNITVGAEVGYYYSSSDGNSTFPTTSTQNDQTNSGTVTDIILRFYF